MIKYATLLFVVLLSFTACNTEKKVLKEIAGCKRYYFPIEDLMGDGYVYEYLDDSLKKEFILHKAVKDEAGDLYLVSATYNEKFEQICFSREWIVADGTLLKDYQFIVTDSLSGKSMLNPAKIEENTFFPFSVSPNSNKIYRYSLKSERQSDSSLSIYYSRERKFDKFLEYEYEGNKKAAIQFSGTEHFRNLINKNTDLASIEIIEIYAENLGLVFTERKAAGYLKRKQLNRRISLDVFIKLQSENK